MSFFVPTKQGLIMLCLLNWAYKWPTKQGLKRMTPSCLDYHFFKGAYLIGLNHIIFCADEIGLKECLLNWAYKWPTEQGLNHVVLTQLGLQMAN